MSLASPAPDAGRPEPFPFLGTLCLVAVGLLSFAAFLVFGAFAPDDDRDLRGGSALSDSAVGFAGIVELLRADGVAVTVSRSAAGLRRPGLLVLTPPGDATIAPNLIDDRAGPVLVALPKWRAHPLMRHPGWVEREGTLGPRTLDHLLPVPIDLRQVSGPHGSLYSDRADAGQIVALPTVPIDPLQIIAASADWTPVLLDEAGRVVLARWTGHRVYVLSDPDPIDTRGLATLDGARTAVAVLDDLREGGPVTFDVTLAGFGQPPSLLRLLFEPPLLGATLCAAAAGLLILLMALNRFGPAIAPESVHDFGKRALADNSAGLIALAGREARMAAPYAELARGMALRALAPRVLAPRALAPGDAGAAAGDRLLDAASHSRGLADDWSALAALAAGVRGRADLLAAAARIDRWRRGMTGDHR